MFNYSSGNMYVDVDFTCTTIPGVCPHKCAGCYVAIMAKDRLPDYRKQPFLRTHYFDKPIPKRNCTLFMNNMIDMGANDIPHEFIMKTIQWCKTADDSVRIMFQSRNVPRMIMYVSEMRPHWIFGTTVETWPEPKWYRKYISKAPSIDERLMGMRFLTERFPGREFFITVEPPLEFEPVGFAKALVDAKPHHINIGGFSGNKPEAYRKVCQQYKKLTLLPSAESVKELIREIKGHAPTMIVNIKENALMLADHTARGQFKKDMIDLDAHFMDRVEKTEDRSGQRMLGI